MTTAPESRAERRPGDPRPSGGGADAVSLDDVERAAGALAGAVVRTPSARSVTLSRILGADVVVKFESLQFTGSFKERGALNRLLALSDDERRRGVVAVSAGNHAQGVAHHAARLGIPATIVMPTGTPFVKVARTRQAGVDVEVVGSSLEDSFERATVIERDEGRTPIHPFDDPMVIAGQGTVALEMLADHPDLEVLAVPVGGGGLLSGMGVAAKALSPDIEVVGVQSAVYGSMLHALGRGGPPPATTTVADGIAVRTPGRLAPALVAAVADDVLAVSEESIEIALNLYLDVEKVVAEGAGAAALAGLVEYPDRFRDRRVGVVLSGANIDPRLLSSVIIRGLLAQGRLSRLEVEVPDRPGVLSDVTAVVAGAGGNIVDVGHQRLSAAVPSRAVELALLVETLDRQHAAAIVEALRAGGYAVKGGGAVAVAP